MDVGGTWLRAVAVDARGRILGKRRRRAPKNARELASSLRSLLRGWGIKPAGAVVGSRGIWDGASQTALERALKPLAARVEVVSDVEIAWRAGLRDRAGVLVLAGTGSCILGRDDRGNACRVGGLGPLLGDEGSAFWIGREWAKTLPAERVLRLAHHPQPARAVAALAHVVLGRSPKDGRARRIAAQARRLLLLQADTAARKLGLRGPVLLSWHGGLFRSTRFLRDFLQELRRSRRRWIPLPPSRDSALAAALSAARRGPAATRRPLRATEIFFVQ